MRFKLQPACFSRLPPLVSVRNGANVGGESEGRRPFALPPSRGGRLGAIVRGRPGSFYHDAGALSLTSRLPRQGMLLSSSYRRTFTSRPPFPAFEPGFGSCTKRWGNGGRCRCRRRSRRSLEWARRYRRETTVLGDTTSPSTGFPRNSVAMSLRGRFSGLRRTLLALATVAWGQA